MGCDVADEDGRLSRTVVALADRYVAGPLPLRRVENSELLGGQGPWVCSNVTTVVDCNGNWFLDEVELNSVVLLCEAAAFCGRLACASLALSRLRQVSLGGLTIAPPS
jgi:hypothetical protein